MTELAETATVTATVTATAPAGDGADGVEKINFGDTPTAGIGQQYADWQKLYGTLKGNDGGQATDARPLTLSCDQVTDLIALARSGMAAFLAKQPTHVVVHTGRTDTRRADPVRIWTVQYTGGQVVAPHEYFQLDAKKTVSQTRQRHYYEQVAAMDHDWTIGPVIAVALRRLGYTNVSLVEYEETDLPVLRNRQNPDSYRYLSQHMNFPLHHAPRHTGHALKVGDTIFNLQHGRKLAASEVRTIDTELALFLWSRAADLSKNTDGTLCPLAATFMETVNSTAEKIQEFVQEQVKNQAPK